MRGNTSHQNEGNPLRTLDEIIEIQKSKTVVPECITRHLVAKQLTQGISRFAEKQSHKIFEEIKARESYRQASNSEESEYPSSSTEDTDDTTRMIQGLDDDQREEAITLRMNELFIEREQEKAWEKEELMRKERLKLDFKRSKAEKDYVNRSKMMDA